MDVDEVFRRQYGIITRAQASRAGLTTRQIDHRLRSGVWDREHRAVYRHRAVAPTWESHLLAACLAAGGVASHRCAAALWNLGLYRAPVPEVTVPRSGRPQPMAGLPYRIHETTQWDDRDEVLRRNIPLTGINRTLLDCGAVMTLRRLEYRILASDGSLIMQADLAWPQRRKVWELDGLQFHFGRTDRERDTRKRNRAKADGWNVQEILWSMYVDDPVGLVDLCRRFLAF